MAKVIAIQDIVTAKGFRVARKGDKGVAFRDVVPHEAYNFGKVLTMFNGCTHGYWVPAESLRFHNGVRVETYISKKPEVKDPYAGIPKVPVGSVFDFHFGNNLRLVRLSRRLSQGRLSGLVGVAQSALSYREKQAHPPQGQLVTSLAKALQVPEYVFFLPFEKCACFGEARDFLNRLSSTVCGAEIRTESDGCQGHNLA